MTAKSTVTAIAESMLSKRPVLRFTVALFTDSPVSL